MTSGNDVIIIGGSYAGLSAALALGRANRTVLVIDNGNPCNKSVERSHNFLSHDGDKPSEIIKKARAEVLKYPTVKILNTEALQILVSGEYFEVTTEGNKKFSGAKLLFATGISDILPGIAGFAECWGRTILHCPYCHGYEVKDTKMAILANSEHAYHLCALLSNLSKDITLYTNGPVNLTDYQIEVLSRQKISIVEKRLHKIIHNKGIIKKLLMIDGSDYKCDVMFAKVLLKQHSGLPDELGCKIVDHLISVDDCQKTSVKNVFAAGDNCLVPRTISYAVAAGTRAAFTINWELLSERLDVNTH